jgi:hypothetical protein
MSSVIPVKIKGKFYFYLSNSFRDKKTGKPATKRKYIGSLDSDNRLVLNEFYLKYIEENNLILELEVNKIYSKLSEKGIILNIPLDANRVVLPYNNTNNDVNYNLLNKSYSLTTSELDNLQLQSLGAGYFLDNICNNIGLKDILQDVFPIYWDKILTLVYFLIDTEDSYCYLNSWVDNNIIYSTASDLNCQQIDKLLSKISDNDILNFQNKWFKYINEKNYYVYDIITPSSYSNIVDFTETGYIRKRDIISNLNLCLIIGEKSRLPIYRLIYPAPAPAPEATLEVATLMKAIEADPILQVDQCKLVLDNGFYSLKNIDYLLRQGINKQFIISLPYDIAFSNHILNNKLDISNPTNYISCGSDIFYADTETIKWNDSVNLYKYCYYNEKVYVDSYHSLVQKALNLIEIVKNNQLNKIYIHDIEKYLSISNINDQARDQNITINYEAIEKEIKYLGWVVILSNRRLDVNSVINYYRARDITEKVALRFFERICNQSMAFNLPENIESKIFITFIAVIIISHIENIMYINNLHDKYSFKGLFKILNQITLKIIKNRSYLNELTPDQKEIFSAFKVPGPTRDSRLA